MANTLLAPPASLLHEALVKVFFQIVLLTAAAVAPGSMVYLAPLLVTALIYFVAIPLQVHLNPCISVGFWGVGKIDATTMALKIVTQLASA